jgi:GDP-D-mannose dehydratase
VIGSINMLGLAKRVHGRILQASTSEIYGAPTVHPQTEDYWGNVNPIGIRSCYDEGKRAAETLFFDYHRQNGVDIKVLRIFNTYGPNMDQNDGRVVSNFIVQAIKGKPLTIYGDGQQTRSFCYVDDLVEGMIRMMESENGFTGPCNIGNPGEFTMLELAEKVIALTGSPSEITFKPLPQDDPRQRKPDITLIKEKLNRKTALHLRIKYDKINNEGEDLLDNPHDKRYKELFSNKKSFLSLLRDCVKEPWVADLDESSVSKSENSFILQDFSEKEADIVYEAAVNGKKVIFYILLELQSEVDYRMPYRLLLYITEILRHYFNHADVNERNRKDFKFPVVFPIVFFNGSDKWTVPHDIRDMFADYEDFGDYVLNFQYALVDAKGYDEESLRSFSSKLLAVVLMLEKSRNDVEFYSNFQQKLMDVKEFDSEETRIFNLCLKIADIAYGYNRGEKVRELLAEGQVEEVDGMLCDMIEYAKIEKEQLRFEKAVEIAKNLLRKGLSVKDISESTGLDENTVTQLELELS